MKILITENNLNEFILKYIEDYYDWNRITLEEDEDGNEDSRFFYLDSDEYNISDIFYYNAENGSMSIYDKKFSESLTSLFNRRWIPIFKKFIKYKYGINFKIISLF